MRVLYLPISSNGNINGCSSYNVGKKFVRNAIKRGWFVHWVLPTIGEDSMFEYSSEPDELENHPSVMVHRVHVVKDQYIQTGTVPSEYLYNNFGQHEGKYHIDAVMTEKPGSVLYLKKLLQHPFTRNATTQEKIVGKAPIIPVFIRDPFTKSEKIHSISPEEELAQTLGYSVGYNAFLSKPDMDSALNVAKKYLNFAQVKKLRERSIVIPAGTDTEELDKIKGTVPKRDKYTVLVAERMKNGPMMSTLDAVDYLFKSGMDMNVVLSSQATTNPFTLANYPTLFEHAELHVKNPREKYLPLAMSCHSTITMPETHSYPQGLMEQLYLGLIAVLPDYSWVTSTIPDYPFMVKRNMTEMVAMLKWIGENYEEAQKKMEWVPEYIKTHYDSKNMSNKLFDYMEETTERLVGYSSVSGGMTEVIEKLGNKTEITEKELFKFMKDSTRSGVSYNNDRKTAAFGNYKSMLFRVMKSQGWVDLCDGPYVHFRKDA